jgi:hypothetical protein
MGTSETAGRSWFYLAVIVVALLVTLYLILHLIGFLFRLLFLVAVVAIGLAAWRAWRGGS